MRLIAPVEQQLRERLGEYIFGVDDETISDAVNSILVGKNLRLSLVETSTRGELAQWLTAAAQGDVAFAGGMVISDPSSLAQILDMPPSLVEEQTFPSQEAADAAAPGRAPGSRRRHGPGHRRSARPWGYRRATGVLCVGHARWYRAQ